MKSIEERAQEYIERHRGVDICCFTPGGRYSYHAEKVAYEVGATEQKAIDDAELLKSSQRNCRAMLEKLIEYLRTGSQEDLVTKYNELSEFLFTEPVTTLYHEANYKQGYHDAIEKACNIFCHTGCPHKTDSYDCLNNKCDTWKIFRKMMEE